MEKTERKHRQQTQTANTEKTQKENTDRKHREKTPPQPQKHLQYYSVPQSTGFYDSFEHPARRKWRKGRSATLKVCISPEFWTSNTHKVTRGLPWSAEEFAFYHSFQHPTRPKWRKGCSATSKICILPQFCASDTSEVTKGSPRTDKNLRFTTVSSVRHVRSDERVARRAEKFAFYHSFAWASNTSEVTKGSIG